MPRIARDAPSPADDDSSRCAEDVIGDGDRRPPLSQVTWPHLAHDCSRSSLIAEIGRSGDQISSYHAADITLRSWIRPSATMPQFIRCGQVVNVRGTRSRSGPCQRRIVPDHARSTQRLGPCRSRAATPGGFTFPPRCRPTMRPSPSRSPCWRLAPLASLVTPPHYGLSSGKARRWAFRIHECPLCLFVASFD
jgi:hypothetical protein